MAAVGPTGGSNGGDGNTGPIPWYIAQLQMLVKTVGVSGVFLGVILWGLYTMANRLIDIVQPQVNAFVAKQIQFIGSIEESNRTQAQVSLRQAEASEQKNAILMQMAESMQSTDAKVDRVHDRLGKIEEAVTTKKKESEHP